MTSHPNPLISFVVLCYNHGRFLGDCLNSILRQEGDYPFEIIFVDDASTDDSQAVARTFTDPRIRFIFHDKNRGHIASVHDGLREARGAYIARIDSDDRYRSYYLKEVLDVFRRFPEVGLVYGDAALINERGEVAAETSDRVHGGEDFRGNEFARLLEENFICAPTVIARREAWCKTLPVPQGLAFHDWYFTLMMAREYDFYYVDRVLADYRVHAANLHTAIIKNKTEEPSIFWLLDRIFRERESSDALEREKRRVRRRVYGAHYLTLANKYFGCHMNKDARRCYLKAIRHKPSYLLRFDVTRRLAATYIGRKAYETSKSSVKAVLAPLARVRQ